MGAEDYNGNRYVGTSALKVDRSGSTELLTCAHLWNACDGVDITNDKAYQGGDYLGYVTDYDATADWATVKPDSDESLDGTILQDSDTDEGDGYRYDVHGHYSESAIADLVSSDEYVRKMGHKSGLTKGPVDAKDVELSDWECVDYDHEGVRAWPDFGEGDSGCPVYNLETINSRDKAVIVSIGQVWNNTDGNKDYAACDSSAQVEENVEGTAFYRLNNYYNISVV